MLATSLFPVAWLIVAALKLPHEIVAHPERFWPGTLTLSNFQRVLNETDFLRGLANSVWVAVPVSIVVTLVAAGIAFMVGHARANLQSRVAGAMLLGYLLPPVVLALPMFLLFAKMRLTGSLMGLAWAHASFLLPFAYWTLQDRIKALPRGQEDAVLLDGGTMATAAYRVWWPFFRAPMVVVAALTFTVSMNDYVLARFVVGGQAKTLPLVLQSIFDYPENDWGLMCGSGALAAVMLTIPLIATLAFARDTHFGGSRG